MELLRLEPLLDTKIQSRIIINVAEEGKKNKFCESFEW